MAFNFSDYIDNKSVKTRYSNQLDRIAGKGIDTQRFKDIVEQAINNIQDGHRSFCIYGEPQCGKTEMMIVLTAKLLDIGYKVIIILINDDVNLLGQNSKRFSASGLDPTPKIYRDIIDPNVVIGDREWVIFCKKNAKDLQKLIEKLDKVNNKVVIDDEGDYATPNSKINKNTKTKINELVGSLLGDGIYIAVTATPARIDLNNVFNNTSSNWLYFKPHNKYTGQDVFFPISGDLNYCLKKLPNEGDDPKFLREALFRFFVNVSFLNQVNENNYCMLVHTSGKRADHSKDHSQIVDIFNILCDQQNKDFVSYVTQIFNFAKEKLNGEEDGANKLTKYILDNIQKHDIVVMNSDVDKKNFDCCNATDPVSLFTIAIGGNIVSRGVTFNNLLSMFFTRDVKNKMQQDTYIQRARMFGSRGDYLNCFELTIPEELYADWHKCFIFHRLSLQSVKSGNIPVWIEDARIRSVTACSIDKTNVITSGGEMGFSIFDYSKEVEDVLLESLDSFSKLDKLSKIITEESLPKFLIEFIIQLSQDGINSLAIHKTSDIINRADVNKEFICRAKGFIGDSEMEKEKYPHAMHHIKIFLNSKTNKARIFYRYINNVKFLKNLKQH